jgi:hypothetical protein
VVPSGHNTPPVILIAGALNELTTPTTKNIGMTQLLIMDINKNQMIHPEIAVVLALFIFLSFG